MKIENCCKNCENAKNYSGFEDFTCKASGYMQRAEQYDCKDFIPRKDTIESKV